MATLNKHARSPHSPSPIYGIRPGFTIGDIEAQYTTEISVYNGRTTSDSSGTTVSPKARVVKITITMAGSGSVDVSAKTAADGTTTVFDSGGLTIGSYEFFVGGWSSPDSDGSTYGATQYGPVKSGSSPEAGNTTGDEETTNPDPSADSNYVGGTYNPFEFLSLDGYDLIFKATLTGTGQFSVAITRVS